MTMCCNEAEPLLHYTGESKVYYLDLGEWSKGRAITAVVSITSDDASLTLASLAILTVDTSDYDRDGNAITIEANTGVQWTMSGGTAGVETDEYTATVTITYTTAAGTEQCPVLVKVLDP